MSDQEIPEEQHQPASEATLLAALGCLMHKLRYDGTHLDRVAIRNMRLKNVHVQVQKDGSVVIGVSD
jgi:hypothetical protein